MEVGSQWEYKCVIFTGSNVNTSHATILPGQEKFLNDLGEYGWELIGVWSTYSGAGHIFKRPKPR